eukprot:comp39132_c0_seq1/m.47374 comp39132_c0_seq1/g.47374  ORF comp39132_c0_seq1/g.47374 comp39132_c0_seq1/m.47374 type:complete len:323 (-) comp39132_c0_seq1:626-1594(-)
MKHIEALQRDVKALREQVTAYHKDDKILLAAKTAAQIFELMNKYAAEHEPVDEDGPVNALRAELLKDTELTEVLKKGDEIHDYQLIFSNTEGWSTFNHSSTIKVMYRQKEGSPFHTIRVEAEINASVFNMLVVLNEVELYQQWVPNFNWPLRLGLVECRRLANLSRVSQLLYAVAAVPWPFAWRDFPIHLWASDSMEEGKVVIVAHTVEEHPGAIIPPCEDKVRAEVHGCIVLKCQGDNKSHLSMVWDIDPRISAVPASLVNFFVERFVGYGITTLEQTASTLSQSYVDRVLANQSLYGYIKARLGQSGYPVTGFDSLPDAL